MMVTNIIIYILYVSVLIIVNSESRNFCVKNTEKSCKNSISQFGFVKKRYILYDVNPMEGFNLRRDVYIRIVTFIKHLNKADNNFKWSLVLPPWSDLYHWKSTDIGFQQQLPWGLFFDLKSFKRYNSVLEMYEFFDEYSSENGLTVLDQVYLLKNDEKMFKTGKFVDENLVINCSEIKKNEKIKTFFWNYKNITALKFNCIIFHGSIFSLKKNIKPEIDRTIMFNHMEIPLHHSYGSLDYWTARRSMRYSLKLYETASEFRKKYLNSYDDKDQTKRPEDWTLEKENRNAIGGPYLAVHYRRQDFVFGHPESVPSILDASAQIDNYMEFLKLSTIFIATDAEVEEYNQLKNQLKHYRTFRYVPSKIEKYEFKDGGISIIDQIICSHARYFVGTRGSTFTMRIQEDREIIGFPVDTTYNVLCVNETICKSESRWEIIWN